MKNPFQVSFTIMIIFTILVLGVVANEELGKPKICGEVIKESGCVKPRCNAACKKKWPKSEGDCSRRRDVQRCVCIYPCP